MTYNTGVEETTAPSRQMSSCSSLSPHRVFHYLLSRMNTEIITLMAAGLLLSLATTLKSELYADNISTNDADLLHLGKRDRWGSYGASTVAQAKIAQEVKKLSWNCETRRTPYLKNTTSCRDRTSWLANTTSYADIAEDMMNVHPCD